MCEGCKNTGVEEGLRSDSEAVCGNKWLFQGGWSQVCAGLPDVSGPASPSAWHVFLQPVNGMCCVCACGTSMMVTAGRAGVLLLGQVRLLPASSACTSRDRGAHTRMPAPRAWAEGGKTTSCAWLQYLALQLLKKITILFSFSALCCSGGEVLSEWCPGLWYMCCIHGNSFSNYPSSKLD